MVEEFADGLPLTHDQFVNCFRDSGPANSEQLCEGLEAWLCNYYVSESR